MAKEPDKSDRQPKRVRIGGNEYVLADTPWVNPVHPDVMVECRSTPTAISLSFGNTFLDGDGSGGPIETQVAVVSRLRFDLHFAEALAHSILQTVEMGKKLAAQRSQREAQQRDAKSAN